MLLVRVLVRVPVRVGEGSAEGLNRGEHGNAFRFYACPAVSSLLQVVFGLTYWAK